MKKHVLSRRQFNAQCAAFALTLPAISALARADQATATSSAAAAAPATARRTVRFPDSTVVPAVGIGTWHLGQDRHPVAVETEALTTGLALGMTLIDTSGNYGKGRSESFIGQALAGQRDKYYLVTKVEGDEVAGDGIARACAASLARLRSDHIDLYLLHWPPASKLFAGIVTAFEQLRHEGKIRAWGVSNFDRGQMEDLWRVPDGKRCATNQVSYSLNDRGIEKDLLPWCAEHKMPVMAYSPLGGDHHLVMGDATLKKIADAHGCSAAAVALAWVIRSGKVIAIPESGSPEHTKENAVALSLTLTDQDLAALDAAFH
jgi:diketogulonate reductase-like aldo/keto reductase